MCSKVIKVGNYNFFWGGGRISSGTKNEGTPIDNSFNKANFRKRGFFRIIKDFFSMQILFYISCAYLCSFYDC